VFGAFAVLRGLPRGIAAADLGSALMVLALLATASVVAFSRHDNPTLPDRPSFRTAFAKLCLWTLGVVFTVLVSGVLVADSGSLERCLGWPRYGGRWTPADALGWAQMLRGVIAGLATILVVAVVVQAWRMPRKHAAIPRVATAVGVLLLVETVVGALMPRQDGAVSLLVIQVAMAAALWAMLVVLVVLAGLGSPLPAEKS
jgi:heme A synthase